MLKPFYRDKKIFGIFTLHALKKTLFMNTKITQCGCSADVYFRLKCQHDHVCTVLYWASFVMAWRLGLLDVLYLLPVLIYLLNNDQVKVVASFLFKHVQLLYVSCVMAALLMWTVWFWFVFFCCCF